MEINYFGKPYSFTHVAALKRFGKDNDYTPNSTIKKTIEAIINNSNSIAVVPIENTFEGFIDDTVDLLCENTNLAILEELQLPIKLFLLSNGLIRLPEIKEIYSHAYPLKISRPWIKSHISDDVELKATNSTSDAVYQIRRKKYSCAIASAEAARYYGLRKLKEIVVEKGENITMFFVLKKK